MKIGQYIHQWASPKWFYTRTTRLMPWLWTIALVLLMAGAVWGLAIAPPDYQQHDSARIMYVHVPTAILAQSCFLIMTLSSAVFLIWKIKLADMVAAVVAPFGAWMTAAALFSGALWGIPTWGTWWVWDARLTSMLVLLFLYLGVIALRGAFGRKAQGAKAAGVIALMGLVNLPIIKYSVVWWSTLHQPATFSLTHKPAMPPSMWLPLLVMVLGFYGFMAAVVVARTRNEILRRETGATWLAAMFTASDARRQE